MRADACDSFHVVSHETVSDALIAAPPLDRLQSNIKNDLLVLVIYVNDEQWQLKSIERGKSVSRSIYKVKSRNTSLSVTI